MQPEYLHTLVIWRSTIMVLLPVTQPFVVIWLPTFSNGMPWKKVFVDDVPPMIFWAFRLTEKENSLV